jgi:hypothetical protein
MSPLKSHWLFSSKRVETALNKMPRLHRITLSWEKREKHCQHIGHASKENLVLLMAFIMEDNKSDAERRIFLCFFPLNFHWRQLLFLLHLFVNIFSNKFIWSNSKILPWNKFGRKWWVDRYISFNLTALGWKEVRRNIGVIRSNFTWFTIIVKEQKSLVAHLTSLLLGNFLKFRGSSNRIFVAILPIFYWILRTCLQRWLLVLFYKFEIRWMERWLFNSGLYYIPIRDLFETASYDVLQL